MNCSERCFLDEIAKQYIRKHGRMGTCELTGATEIKVVEASKLMKLFEPLLSMYASSADSEAGSTPEGGASLFECIQNDTRWQVFSKDLSPGAGCRLLDAIRGCKRDGARVPSDAQWFVRDSGEEGARSWWNKFSDSIKHQSRFFPVVSGHRPEDPRSVLAPHLSKFVYTLVKGKKMYRARMGECESTATGKRRPFPPGPEIGAPPASKAAAGRVNPTGLSFLYCADEEATAIAEARPHVGASVSIARFEALQQMKLVDVAKVRRVFSPLGCKDLSSTLLALQLLEVLNEQLSVPVIPDTAEIAYLPTQYLSEVVRVEGYDGIRYRSGLVDDGTNFVLFDHSKTVVSETKLVDVLQIAVRYRDVTPYQEAI